MKKILIVSLLILALCLSLTACGQQENIADMLKSHGIDNMNTLKPNGENDTIKVEITDIEEKRTGDVYLLTSASFEEVLFTVYSACEAAADDKIVRDFMTEEPMEFTYGGEEIVWFGYMYGETFHSVAISVYSSDPESITAFEASPEIETAADSGTAATEANEASTEASTEAETAASTEAAPEADAVLTIYLLQWD